LSRFAAICSHALFEKMKTSIRICGAGIAGIRAAYLRARHGARIAFRMFLRDK
jgi:glycine/D-amino acid oxidase-like deaminating enzyme